LLGSRAVSLAFLWAINAAQADTFGAVAVQDFEDVAVEDGDDEAGEVGGKAQNRTQQNDVNEPRNCCD
jgi:hypothetical protein